MSCLCANPVLYVAGAVLAGVGIGWLVFHCRQRRKQHSLASQSAQISSKEIAKLSSSKGLSSTLSKNFTRSIPSYPSSPSYVGRGSSYFGVQVFNYVELEEATNNFDPSRELGEGGFGTVYYGMRLLIQLEPLIICISDCYFDHLYQFKNLNDFFSVFPNRGVI